MTRAPWRWRPASRRTATAAIVLVGALAALLVAWFLSGWADVRARQQIVRDGPQTIATQRATELARELRDELAGVLERESARKYYHYQNVFHDPQQSASVGVTPSPLSSGPDDPLVLGHFRIDESGRVTTPTINDDVPSLSEPLQLAGNAEFRNEVARTIGGSLTPKPVERPVRVASASATPTTRRPPPAAPHRPSPPPPQPVPPQQVAQNDGQQQQQQQPQQRPMVQSNRRQQAMQPQVVRIDNNSFEQNNFPNVVYQQQQEANRPPPPATNQRAKTASTDHVANAADGSADSAAYGGATPPHDTVKPTARAGASGNARPSSSDAGTPKTDSTSANTRAENPLVTVVVSPFEWKTFPFRGGPALVAVRSVQMPDQSLAQGFVIDRSTVTSWLADRAGESVAELRSDGVRPSPSSRAVSPRGSASRAIDSHAIDSHADTSDNDHGADSTEMAASEIAPGWHLSVAPNPKAVAAANLDADSLARHFMIRFVVVGIVASLAALFVVLLVARAEALARERSKFAAAAAHELRTPLAGLQLYGDMLADGLGDPAKMRDYARRMSEEASRLGRVVSNVLGFSQLERGNLSVEARIAPLGEALTELAERARPALDRAGAKLELEVDHDNDELVARFDRDALARIVANLLDNAEKYSRGADDRTIRLVAREVDDGIEVAVIDRGPGIDARGRIALFRPFKRGVDGDGPAGLGLGLALSQSLARAMSGDLAYRSTAEGGATFVLRLAKA